MVRPGALAVAAVLAACQGKAEEPAKPPPPRDAAAVVAAADANEADAGPKLEEPEPVDPGKQLADMDAVPAWQAVVDRAQYLERRGQHGVAYGTVGPAVMVL